LHRLAKPETAPKDAMTLRIRAERACDTEFVGSAATGERFAWTFISWRGTRAFEGTHDMRTGLAILFCSALISCSDLGSDPTLGKGGSSTGGSSAGGSSAGGSSAGGSSAGGSSAGGGTAGTGGVTACSSGTAQTGDITIDLSSLQQKISGFGVSSAWAGDFRDPENDPDMLWSTTTGAGLTLHRIRIGGGSTSETRIAQRAVEYGVKVWATPWEVDETVTDRPMCPTNDPCDPPPKLIDPEEWANKLVAFVTTMEQAGVPIHAISAENEPDSGGMNHTVSFTATELAEWIGSHLGPALAGTNTKVMGPETMNWYGFPAYFDAIRESDAAWEHVSIFASHAYGLGPTGPEPAISGASKEYWQTEVDTGRAPDDPTGDNIASALMMAEAIHDHLTLGNLNAWHYWWLWAGGTSGVFNTTTNVWTKRLWVLGNFSRFVRPGYMRVSTSGTAPSGVLLSAYTNAADGTVVVVAINKNASPTPVSLFVSDPAPCNVTPWVTSDTDNVAAKQPIAITDARFTATLEASSVTTFVGSP
jgi:glucuronoarabinoxylan endo-1,4-beta-xylanase